jgi:tetratricopeptide (TPR) repeat protein
MNTSHRLAAAALACIAPAIALALASAPAQPAYAQAQAQAQTPAAPAQRAQGAAPGDRPATPHDSHGQHDHGTPERLGGLSFPTSCAPAVQKTFERGVALLHSFWYEESEKTFVLVTQRDPSCTLGYWGVAMTQYRPVWAPPTAAEFAKGRAAVDRARLHPAKTPRERGYVDAVAAFFQNPAAPDHRARAVAYERAMQTLHEANAGDDEATIFYALSLLGTASAADKTYAQQKKAGALLNAVLPKHPDHPGVAHYLIHSFDSPALAPLAVEAARSYARIAPSAPHALHMPSHIFVRLGDWNEAIASNLASADAAHRHLADRSPEMAAFDELHALDYLAYAWLQRGEDDQAGAVVQRIATVRRLDLPNFAAGYALAAIPARYALERRAWAEAAAIPARPEGFPWDTVPYAEAPSWYGRALGAARSGNATAARESVAKLVALQAALRASNDPYWPDQIEIQTRAANAWIARVEGRDDDALRLMRMSADLEASTEKHPVTPGALLPSREQLGDLLLDVGRADEALREYETSLTTAPKRLNSLYGAARAAQKIGDRDKATQYFTALVAQSDKTNNTRPAIVEARAFLAGGQ